MGELAAQLVVLALWVGYVFAVVLVERRSMRAKASLNPDAGYIEPEIGGWFWGLLLLCGAIALPWYFYQSRRSVAGLLAGVGLTVFGLIAISVLLTGVNLMVVQR